MSGSSSVRVITNKFPKAALELSAGSKLIVVKSAQRIASAASSAAPRLTGTLAGSVRATGNVVTASAPYSGYVEHGTGDTPAQPFFFPAFDAERPRLEQDLLSLLRKLG